MAKQYRIQNYIIGDAEFYDTEKEALARIKEIESELMALNVGRFNVIQISESAKGTLWIAPSENSQEDGDYMVFNSNFGTHEKIKGRTAAFARNQELKDAFMAEFVQEPVLAEKPAQPISIGTQEL